MTPFSGTGFARQTGRRFAAIPVAGLIAGLTLLAPAWAQTAAPGQGVAAPRLEFTDFEWALAEAVATDPGLAGFYGSNGLTPVFAGDTGAARRQALADAVAHAAEHGLPPARYALPAGDAAAQGSDPVARAQAELQTARVAALWVRDLTGGLLDPSTLAPDIKRKVTRPPLTQVLDRFLKAPDPVAYLAGLGPRDPRYAMLQKALGGGSDLIAPPDAPKAPEVVLRPGQRGPGVADLRARLASIGFAADSADPQLYDQPLADAVRAYQTRAGLTADGVSGPQTARRLNGGFGPHKRDILIALERMRWLGDQDLNARHVWVNIPEYTAEIRQDGQRLFQTRVVVGKANNEFHTPEFSDQMEFVVVNPRWNVPRSITVKEYLPRLQKNPNAVSHLDVVDSRGRVVPRGQINFGQYTASSFPYRMRQKPSDDNALGVVKFIFPNPWNIYLHDTPTKHLFANARRAYSHGCVRVGDPVDLATALLSPQSDDPRGLFDRARASGDERWLKLEPPVPVHLVYFTALPDQTGRIRHYADIYGRDAAVWNGLLRAGLESGDAEG
ncbi:L,D-transpeptidase family protein [Paracoccus jiaweipingae]|uniref:L,D-transpeptidase family protein n=1 Tax=unclassified Paracoccus (in: a-proteobacteria) TaxID=2688777 RepID=UPI0037B513F4